MCIRDSLDRVHRHDEDEVDDGRGHEEHDDRVDDAAEVDEGLLHAGRAELDAQTLADLATAGAGQQRVDDVADECVDDLGECGTCLLYTSRCV